MFFNRFHKIRDSIQAAAAGNLVEEDSPVALPWEIDLGGVQPFLLAVSFNTCLASIPLAEAGLDLDSNCNSNHPWVQAAYPHAQSL